MLVTYAIFGACARTGIRTQDCRSVARLLRRPSLQSPVASVSASTLSVCPPVLSVCLSLSVSGCVCVCRGSGGGGRPHRQVCQRAPPPHAPKGPKQRPRPSHHALQGVGWARGTCSLPSARSDLRLRLGPKPRRLCAWCVCARGCALSPSTRAIASWVRT